MIYRSNMKQLHRCFPQSPLNGPSRSQQDPLSNSTWNLSENHTPKVITRGEKPKGILSGVAQETDFILFYSMFSLTIWQ